MPIYATSWIMLRCQFLCHVLKAIFFIKIALKLSYFCKKMQNFRALGAVIYVCTLVRVYSCTRRCYSKLLLYTWNSLYAKLLLYTCVLLYAKMLKETKTEETRLFCPIFFICDISIGGGGAAPPGCAYDNAQIDNAKKVIAQETENFPRNFRRS